MRQHRTRTSSLEFGRPDRGGGEGYNPSGDAIGEDFSTKSVIGTDNRLLLSNQTAWPYSTNIAMWYQPSGGTSTYEQGSATLIGASTAVSVAHNFYGRAFGAAKWYNVKSWAPGADAYDTNRYPFGQWNGCYWVTIPSGWFGYYMHKTLYDYAVIEYSYNCGGNYPGSAAGWVGWQNYSLNQNWGYIFGYPGTGQSVGNPPVAITSPASYPTLWGHFGTSIGYPSSESWGCQLVDPEQLCNAVFHQMDTSGGNSGSGVVTLHNGGWYVTAMHRGDADYAGYNLARKMDSNVMQFIIDHSAL